MKTIIVGAGELGRGLLPILIEAGHEIVMIDTDADKLSQLSSLYDMTTLCGDSARLSVLKHAGIQTCQIFIAASSNDAANILACRFAQHFKVQTIVCRCHGNDYFSEEDGLTPESYGICKVVDSEAECSERVNTCLDNRYTLEKIHFTNKQAVMTCVKIMNESPITGFPLRLLPERERLDHVRLAGLLRNHRLIFPRGDTSILPGDELYIAGTRDAVDEIVHWITPSDAPLNRAVIAGASRLGSLIAQELENRGATVSVIEPDGERSEELLKDPNSHAMIIQGMPTDNSILEEAGVDKCDVFISALDSDEDNILCGILARRRGAKKVIVTTKKSEYIEVIPEIQGITTGFNSCLVAVNSVIDSLPHAATEYTGVGAVLQRTEGYVREFTVQAKSPICDACISKFMQPDGDRPAVFALVFRGEEVLVPTGDLILRENDRVVTITTEATLAEVKALFRPSSGFFSL